jgi:large subunit ribosomal protein L3
MTGLLGKKVGMTQIFKDDGKVLPATVIEAGPCFILQIKSKKKDGYSAIQCGFDKQKKKRVNKPKLSHFKKAKVEPLKFIKEILIKEEDEDKLKLGQQLKANLFEPGDYVDITGTTIGKGFQGVMKRWNFRGHPASHGSTIHRAPGSIGASATPSRVVKGKKMPGRMGNEKNTIKNLEIIKVDAENNLLVVDGSVQGKKGNYLIINKSKKQKTRKPQTQETETEVKEEKKAKEQPNQQTEQKK